MLELINWPNYRFRLAPEQIGNLISQITNVNQKKSPARSADPGPASLPVIRQTLII